MFIELDSLFNQGINSVKLDYKFDFSAEEINGVFPFTAPVELTGEIVNTSGIVTVSADIAFSLETVCDRCAESIKLDFNIPMEHELVSSLNNEETDEYILVEDMKLDIEQLTLEDIFLALPVKFLCDDDCKGICVKCGANLNEGSCGCKKDIDPRLEALLGLLDE